jgi:hypothetical protein
LPHSRSRKGCLGASVAATNYDYIKMIRISHPELDGTAVWLKGGILRQNGDGGKSGEGATRSRACVRNRYSLYNLLDRQMPLSNVSRETIYIAINKHRIRVLTHTPIY